MNTEKYHLRYIREEDYKDILMFVESGFVGKWGEQHGGKYTSVDYKDPFLRQFSNVARKDTKKRSSRS